jgi:Eco57I restriction-modification methylase
MGAYYTKEDITEYISKNTVLPFLFDATRAKCKVAFENPNGPTVWDLLKADPDRYIYPAVRHGVSEPLPPEIAAGLNPPTLHEPVGEGPVLTLELRKGWNKPAPPEYALPTETWREVIARRQHYEEIRAKLAAGGVRNVNDLITLNLDIRQFAQDLVENCEDPDLLREFWHAIENVTILDPTCGSGAFLFAALNILEPLYEACLDRMEAFVEDLARSGGKHRPERFSNFRKVLDRVAAHPNSRYFIFKSIILKNLYGVDIIEEGVEICKLRLFLKLAAQVEPDATKPNLGIEPLPDIDFNIRPGNTLVGYATYDEVRRAVTGKLDFDNTMGKISLRAADLQQAFDAFRSRQVEADGSLPAKDKQELRKRLGALDDELNGYLAGEYRVKLSDKARYGKWLKAHQPFHWFVEFYGIMSCGGFDVIIGNPPYVEYKDVKAKYLIRGFQTLPCGDLYAFCVERAVSLLRNKGELGLIVPISVFGTDGFEPLQSLALNELDPIWASCFANRPSQLFEGAQKRLTIVLGRRSASSNARVHTTQYLRWKRKEFDILLRSRIQYAPQHANFSVFPASLEKLGSRLEVQAFSKLTVARGRLAEAVSTSAAFQVYYTRKFGYFLAFLDFTPRITEVKTGRRLPPSELKELGLSSIDSVNAVVAVLSSSTFFWFWNVLSDCRNVNRRDLLAFPFQPEGVTSELKRRLANLGKRYLVHLQKTSRTMLKSGLRIETFEYAECKPIADEIDHVLARHYGLTEEELDFVVNYDIKYRMEVETEDEGE